MTFPLQNILKFPRFRQFTRKPQFIQLETMQSAGILRIVTCCDWKLFTCFYFVRIQVNSNAHHGKTVTKTHNGLVATTIKITIGTRIYKHSTNIFMCSNDFPFWWRFAELGGMEILQMLRLFFICSKNKEQPNRSLNVMNKKKIQHTEWKTHWKQTQKMKHIKPDYLTKIWKRNSTTINK